MTAGIRTASGRLLIAIAAALALPACGGDDITRAPEGTVFVRMADNVFQPETVTVRRGASVRWTNEDAVAHTVISDTQLWQSDLLQPTWWFEVRFEDLGTFGYHCSLHDGMTGTVIVE